MLTTVDEGGNEHQLPEKNMIAGSPCLPDLSGICPKCGSPWTEAANSAFGWFLVRTYIGTVARMNHVRICACGEQKFWLPSSEYIHAISDFEGGEKSSSSIIHKNTHSV